MEYNQILQDKDLERRRGSRTVKRWAESELELMAALDVMAKREKRRCVRCYIATCLGRPLDSVTGKRKESCYKVILDWIRGEDSSKLRALIQCELGHISSGKNKPSPSVSDPVSNSVGPANDIPSTENVGGDLETSFCELPSASHADGKRAFWSDAELEIIGNAKPGTKATELVKLLPGRTAVAIWSKCLKLRFKVDPPSVPPQSREVRSNLTNRPEKDHPDVISERTDLESTNHVGTAPALTTVNAEGLCSHPPPLLQVRYPT